jgi:hypothetical protein
MKARTLKPRARRHARGWQVGEALRLAHENELAPIDPKAVIRAVLAQDIGVSVSTAAERIQGTRLSADSSASWRTDPFREPWGDLGLQAAQAPEPVVTTPIRRGACAAEPALEPNVRQFDQRRR